MAQPPSKRRRLAVEQSLSEICDENEKLNAENRNLLAKTRKLERELTAARAESRTRATTSKDIAEMKRINQQLTGEVAVLEAKNAEARKMEERYLRLKAEYRELGEQHDAFESDHSRLLKKIQSLKDIRASQDNQEKTKEALQAAGELAALVAGGKPPGRKEEQENLRKAKLVLGALHALQPDELENVAALFKDMV